MLPNRHAVLRATTAGLLVVLWGGAARAASGVLDLPAPLLGGVDGLLSGWLPPAARLVLWAVVAAVASMVLYRLTSNQPRLAAIKAEMAVLRSRIAGFDGPFAEMWGLTRRNLVLALRQIWVTLVPAILGSIPVIFLLVWVSNNFDLALPKPGDLVAVQAFARDGAPLPPLRWVPGGARTLGDGRWTVAWPDAGATLELRNADQPLLALPLAAPVGVVHQRRWWNSLLGNPAGYLPPGAVDAVAIALPARTYLPVGPAWLRGWMPLFFAVVLAVSLLLKLAWRLH